MEFMAIGIATGLALSMLCCTWIVCIKLDAIARKLDQSKQPADESAKRRADERRDR